jgi:PhzF family phenazine biosynthesis protein
MAAVLDEIYQVDAFTDRPLSGNPAAVCPLSPGAEWPSDGFLRAVARENNLSETAYFRPSRDPAADFELRWFTPTSEVRLCGHATLATAFVLFQHLGFTGTSIRFATLSGVVTVGRDGDWLTLDFPARLDLEPIDAPVLLIESLGVRPNECFSCGNGSLLAVFDTEEQVASLRPDLAKMAALDQSVIVTAAAASLPAAMAPTDFVSRYFAPHRGVPEDPVTGSSHCVLTPFWGRRLGKTQLVARQVSARGGTLHCKAQGDRVLISGRAVLFFKGRIAPWVD